jgi:DNA-directed RNA polymerase specialized sigma24 family protein
MMTTIAATDFATFFADAEPRLRQAYVGAYGVDRASEAAAEALAYAWQHWDRVSMMESPVGYLYRVGQSRTRPRRPVVLPPPDEVGLPDVEPRLLPALLRLPDRQRTAVWLVYACQWRHREAAEAMGISTSAVSTHVSRALGHLRQLLEVDGDG